MASLGSIPFFSDEYISDDSDNSEAKEGDLDEWESEMISSCKEPMMSKK